MNVLIAAILFLLLVTSQRITALGELPLVGGDFFSKLLYVNVALVAFNLLPAFPMDGGRLLRAALAMRMDYVRATQIAATIGQAMAVVFVVLGFFYNWFLLFIAFFVYLGAQQEGHHVQIRALLRGIPVREAMITRFGTLSPIDPLSVAVDELLAGHQQDFPVVDGGRVTGVLLRRDLMQALAEGKQGARVGDVMKGDCGTVVESAMLEATFESMRQQHCPTLPVVRNDELVGMVTLENVGEWMMIHSSLRHAKARGEIIDILGSE
ncbi:MAG: CBS domain-containing protein [Planctomycetota bacterium]